MTAVKNLPRWGDFVSGRESDMLLQRSDSTQRLQSVHTRTLAKHSDLKKAELEAKAHELWSEGQRRHTKRHKVEGPRMPCPLCERAGH